MTYSRLLVGLDFSDTSLAALDHGAALARATGADLEVLHVHEAPIVPPMAPAHPGGAPSVTIEAYAAGDVLHASQDELGRTLQARELEDLAVPMVRVGDPALTIAETALEEQRDLVIVGTHGRSGLSRVVLGSVAEKVVRHSPCPVLVIPRLADASQ
jgi:nucleotide-binding universal stress UspA family protein